MQNYSTRSLSYPAHIVCASVFALFACAAAAQPLVPWTNAPDAGRTLRESQPVPVLDAKPQSAPSIQLPPAAKAAQNAAPVDNAARKIEVKRFAITGLSGRSLVKEVDLQALIADGVDKALNFAQLNALADRITAYYSGLGYDLARAYLPAQDIRNGLVTFAVVEGRIGKVMLENTTKYPSAAAAKALETLKSGDVVRRQNLEQHLLLLTDQPGVDVTGVLKAGAKPGETDIVVKLRPVVALSNAVDFDNFGSKSTGVNRLGVSVALPSSTVLGEQFALRAMTSGKGLNLANVSWQTPFNGLQDKLTLSATILRYQLGDAFQYLNASGTAKSVGVNWTRTFVRDYQNSVFGSLDLTRKVLDDVKEAVSSSTSKTANVLTASLNGYSNGVYTNPGHLNDAISYGLSYTLGHLRLDSTDSTVGSPRGNFGHFNTNINYQRPFSGRWSAGVTATSQYAQQNQDSSERISLGGPSAVRAYASGEGSGDRGAVVSAEVRYAYNYNWQVSGFYDAGVSQVQVTPTPGSTAANSRHLAGAGLGLQYSLPRAARIKTSLAWRTTADAPQLDTDRKPRLWVNGVVYF